MRNVPRRKCTRSTVSPVASLCLRPAPRASGIATRARIAAVLADLPASVGEVRRVVNELQAIVG
jgi:hypothetical protein